MLIFALIAIFSGPVAHAINGSDMEFHGYMRAGAGTNLKGGAQECFSNAGAPGNEFRLGNECGIYGETALRANLWTDARASTDEKPYFSSQVRFNYAPSGHTSWESTQFVVTEAFAEGGRIEGSPLRFWAGKRFYRNVDVHMNDWYYMEEMSGNGAGVMDVPLGFGKLSTAFLFQVGSTATDSGTNTLNVLDLRLQDVKLNETDSLHFWGAFGWAPGGTSGGTRYVSSDGWLLGARWEHNFAAGFNHFALVRGYRLMQGINMYGDTATLDGPGANYNPGRWRLVNHVTLKPRGTWAFHAIAATDLASSGDPANPGSRWQTLGARPVYFFSDHYQLAFELGHSFVFNESENLGPRTLTRFTIAPQLSISNDIWSRPVLRLFYTRSLWNDANASQIGTSFGGTTWGQALGFQTEIWF